MSKKTGKKSKTRGQVCVYGACAVLHSGRNGTALRVRVDCPAFGGYSVYPTNPRRISYRRSARLETRYTCRNRVSATRLCRRTRVRRFYGRSRENPLAHGRVSRRFFVHGSCLRYGGGSVCGEKRGQSYPRARRRHVFGIALLLRVRHALVSITNGARTRRKRMDGTHAMRVSVFTSRSRQNLPRRGFNEKIKIAD